MFLAEWGDIIPTTGRAQEPHGWRVSRIDRIYRLARVAVCGDGCRMAVLNSRRSSDGALGTGGRDTLRLTTSEGFMIRLLFLALILYACPAPANPLPGAVDVTTFGATGDGKTDDTAAIQKAADVAAARTLAFQPAGGVYLGSAPPVYFPAGHYRISKEIRFGGYANVRSDAGAIIQQTADRRIFVFDGGYTVTVSGIRFLGGTRQIEYANANIDASTLHIEGCEFQLAKEFALYTHGTTDGHLSANLVVEKSRFLLPRQVLHNACDAATIRDCWVFIDRRNFAPDAAAFVNRSGVLMFDNMFGVPSFGDSPEHARVRWVDNHDQFLANRSRFGGEDAGIPIVHHFGKAGSRYPFMGQTVSIENSQISAGRAASPHAGVLTLREGVPQLIRLVGNRYLMDSPYIRTANSLDLEAHLKERRGFKITIEPNQAFPSDPSIPRVLERFLTPKDASGR